MLKFYGLYSIKVVGIVRKVWVVVMLNFFFVKYLIYKIFDFKGLIYGCFTKLENVMLYIVLKDLDIFRKFCVEEGK